MTKMLKIHKPACGRYIETWAPDLTSCNWAGDEPEIVTDSMKGRSISCLANEAEADGSPLPCPGTMAWEGTEDPGGPHEPPSFGYWCCDYCGRTASADPWGRPELDPDY